MPNKQSSFHRRAASYAYFANVLIHANFFFMLKGPDGKIGKKGAMGEPGFKVRRRLTLPTPVAFYLPLFFNQNEWLLTLLLPTRIWCLVVKQRFWLSWLKVFFLCRNFCLRKKVLLFLWNRALLVEKARLVKLENLAQRLVSSCRVRLCVCACGRVCVCVRARARVCVCVCTCVCMCAHRQKTLVCVNIDWSCRNLLKKKPSPFGQFSSAAWRLTLAKKWWIVSVPKWTGWKRHFCVLQ